MRWRDIVVAGGVIGACLIAISLTTDFLVDLLWFKAVGYLDVFWTIFDTEVALFLTVFAGSTVFLWGNGALAFRFAQRRGRALPTLEPGSATTWPHPETLPELIRRVPAGRSWRLLIDGGAVVLGILIALGETGNWDLVLRFIHQVPYGQYDPLYGKDIGFYLFSLPAYVALKNWMLLTVVLSALVTGAVYFAHGDILLENGGRWLSA